MKRFALLLALAVPSYGASMFAHLQQSSVDAYVAAWTIQPPDIPGADKPAEGLDVSISTTDELTQAFVVYLRVRLDDGTESPLRAVVQRTIGSATVLHFQTASKAIKVVHFRVVRLHAEPDDVLFMDLS